jgi:L-threonylcarbamoyladenylate synthase
LRAEKPELHQGNVEKRTLRLWLDPRAALPAESLTIAAEILRSGGTVAFATETVYGLGANALDADAVAKIFLAKQRPAWDPLIVHIDGESMLAQVVSKVPPAARVLMDRFWPGPLTLLMPRQAGLLDAVTAGRANVGVRLPAHPVARALIEAAGVPVAAPSANIFGHVSPTTAAHVAADLDGRIDAILDSGETTLGLESTVLDTSVDPCILYRPGAITLDQLRAAWPSIEVYRGQAASADKPGLASPGLGMRHYAPRARLVLVDDKDVREGLQKAVNEVLAGNESVGVMLPLGLGLSAAEATAVYDWGAWNDADALAHRLFAGLRALDNQGVDVILCPVPATEGIGVAIIDRLRKATRHS